MESWYQRVARRTKSPELRLGEISMLLVSGRTENICTFGQENCAELNYVDKIPWAKNRPGLLWYKNNIKSDLDIQMTKRVK